MEDKIKIMIYGIGAILLGIMASVSLYSIVRLLVDGVIFTGLWNIFGIVVTLFLFTLTAYCILKVRNTLRTKSHPEDKNNQLS